MGENMKPRILTKGELREIENRADEINKLLDLCHESFDADIIEGSHKLAVRKERGFSVVCDEN
jgi:hypothetical protein